MKFTDPICWASPDSQGEQEASFPNSSVDTISLTPIRWPSNLIDSKSFNIKPFHKSFESYLKYFSNHLDIFTKYLENILKFKAIFQKLLKVLQKCCE